MSYANNAKQHSAKQHSAKQNWFPTLNDALESEGLIELWTTGVNLQYGETRGITAEDGTRYGHFISVYRDERGLYERPVHYSRG